jgi:hypothetical protein
MSRLKLIPDIHRDEVQLWEESGYSASTIAELLLQKHNITVSIPTVYRYTRQIRLQRQEAAKNTFAIEVQKTASKDLKTMANLIDKLESAFDKAVANDEVELSLKISSELNKWNARRMELSGIGKDNSTLTETNDADDFQDMYIEGLSKVNKSENDSN